MLRKSIRIAFFIIGILLVLALCAGAAVWIRFYQVQKSGAKVQLLMPPVLPEDKSTIRLGEKIPFTVTFSVPWGKEMLALTAETAKGSQLTEEPAFTKVRTRWGSFLYEGKIMVQPYESTRIDSAKAQASFSGGEVIDFTLPAFMVTTPVVQGTEPVLAGAIDYKGSFYSGKNGTMKIVFTILLVLALLGIVFLAVFYFFLRKKEALIPPWERALASLSELLAYVNTGKLTPANSIAKLTDILREYLEKRFALRASRQTTDEFLRELESGKDSLLTAEQHLFLREFLNTADLVKFAKQDASAEQIRVLASQGEILIKETIPAEDKHKGKGKTQV